MIYLENMSQAEYTTYRLESISRYAQECLENRFWKNMSQEEAKTKATREMDQLLTQGINTPNHYLFTIKDTTLKANVGMVWFGKMKRDNRDIAYLFEINIKEEYRNKGYGKAALTLLEEKVLQAGLNIIQLHVFEKNKPAKALYERTGYHRIRGNETNQVMQKEL